MNMLSIVVVRTSEVVFVIVGGRASGAGADSAGAITTIIGVNLLDEGFCFCSETGGGGVSE